LNGETIIEVKNVVNLSMSPQFRGYDATRRPVILGVSPNIRSISEQVQEFVKDSRGRIEIFDPKTGIFSAWDKN
jgi:filamentous hemagglutinin